MNVGFPKERKSVRIAAKSGQWYDSIVQPRFSRHELEPEKRLLMDGSVVMFVGLMVLVLGTIPFMVRDLRAHIHRWKEMPTHIKLVDGCGLVAAVVGLLFVFAILLPMLVPPQQRSFYNLLSAVLLITSLSLFYICYKVLRALGRAIAPSAERLIDRLPEPKLPPGYLEAEHATKIMNERIKGDVEKINARFGPKI